MTGKVGKNNPPVHTRWKKGQSGNPKGGPKKLPHLDELMADVLGEEKDGMTAARAILAKLRQKATAGDVRAAEVLLDRAYGKARQFMDLSATLSNASDIYIGGKKIPNG